MDYVIIRGRVKFNFSDRVPVSPLLKIHKSFYIKIPLITTSKQINV